MKIRNWISIVLLSILLIIGVIYLGRTVIADSPDKMNLSYDPYNSILMVNITHPVEDNTTHYISGVKVCLREDVFKEYNYTSQPTNEIFQYYFKLEANSGDKIKVGAYCNLGGEIHEDIFAGSRYTSLDIPGFEFLLIIFSLSTILTIIVVYKKIQGIK